MSKHAGQGLGAADSQWAVPPRIGCLGPVLVDWLGYSPLHAPAGGIPVVNQTDWDPILLSPLGQPLGCPADGHKVSTAAVDCLLLIGGPTHVSGLVVSVNVDPVKRIATLGPLAHVRKERLKRGAPLLADDYPSPTVILKPGVVGVVTARDHGPPCLALRCLAQSYCHDSKLGKANKKRKRARRAVHGLKRHWSH
jgi:hypothetical protein